MIKPKLFGFRSNRPENKWRFRERLLRPNCRGGARRHFRHVKVSIVSSFTADVSTFSCKRPFEHVVARTLGRAAHSRRIVLARIPSQLHNERLYISYLQCYWNLGSVPHCCSLFQSACLIQLVQTRQPPTAPADWSKKKGKGRKYVHMYYCLKERQHKHAYKTLLLFILTFIMTFIRAINIGGHCCHKWK